jgi:DNA-binding transcriptional MerR regulator
MTAYTVSQLADMAGVSVRTLHHYDKIDLLKPSARTESGYRLYEEPDLLRLQQILFFKELDLPLSEIGSILDDANFDPLEALENHRRLLQAQTARLASLMNTIDKTIQRLTEDNMSMTDDELYEGFTKEQRERYPREAREQYGEEAVTASEQWVRTLSKPEWQALKAEGEEVNQTLASLMDKAPDDPVVQAAIARHYTMMSRFMPIPAEMYRGWGQMYVEHDEFRAYYEKYRPGMAQFMQAAMTVYADTTLA